MKLLQEHVQKIVRWLGIFTNYDLGDIDGETLFYFFLDHLRNIYREKADAFPCDVIDKINNMRFSVRMPITRMIDTTSKSFIQEKCYLSYDGVFKVMENGETFIVVKKETDVVSNLTFSELKRAWSIHKEEIDNILSTMTKLTTSKYFFQDLIKNDEIESEKQRRTLEYKHKLHLSKYGKKGSLCQSEKPTRHAICWSCNNPINNLTLYECETCGWIVCNCGACGCGRLIGQNEFL